MSKRLPYPSLDAARNAVYWRSLRELDQSPDFQEALLREFPDGAAEPPDGVSRRDFFRVMGASMALAGVAGCRRPDEKILPYSRAPEEVIPGVPMYFATAMPWNGTALGLVVESHEGRPTKIEGNPLHPESLGAANTWAQAEVLNLYDPDRSGAPTEKGQARTWDDAAAALRALGDKARAAGGKGLAVLTEAHRSPTTKRMLDELGKQLPGVQIFRFEPFSRDNAREGARLAFGQRLEPVLRPEKARIIVALDSDFLMHDGGSDVRHQKHFAVGRRGGTQQSSNRLYAVESTFSVTGAMADHRLRLPSHQVTQFAVALAHELGAGRNLPRPQLPERAAFLLRAIVNDLKEHAGSAAIVVGEKQPAVVHALMAHANLAGKNLGSAIEYHPPFEDATEGAASLAALTAAIRDKSVTQLVILGGNPVFNGPSDLGLAELLGALETSVHLSLWRDETSVASQWHLNRAHFLESWSDVRAIDGTTSIIQPLIAPLYDGKTDAEVIAMLLGAPARAFDLVRATHGHGAKGDGAAEAGWRRALHDGLVPQTATQPITAALGGGEGLEELGKAALAPIGGFEVTFVPDAHAYDGRFANNGWMQELPESMTKLTWGNAALVSPATARQLGIGDGDLITITGEGGGKITIPALLLVGHADSSITLGVGQGRSRAGRVGTGVGVDVAPLRTSKAWGIAAAQVARAGGNEMLARTQEHFNMEERALVREATLTAYKADPEFAKKMIPPKMPELRSLYDDKDYSRVQRWALAIDLSTCTGCNACVVACQSENNIPVVGKRGVILSREMHWIRIDRYFKGTREDPQAVAQPMTCQQCENAPCEQVCPVAATTHSPEGLNDMAYNRCIGTKYCSNNCPFKVRRFNYFHYAKEIPQIRRAQFNPDVTVRSRGVMEKCTYCTQRIQYHKIAAKTQGKDRVEDQVIKTACQQTCPTDSIVFGDLNDPKSLVAKLKDEPRSYVLLEELNIRPRTTYLAKLTNPNPEVA
jgi:molybdopterin-containing oxidoreductase family iron-sulfur binding subunit